MWGFLMAMSLAASVEVANGMIHDVENVPT